MNNVVPDGWEVLRVESILDNIIDYRGKSPPKSEMGIPLITAKNVRKGFIDKEPREYIYEDQYDMWMVRGTPKFGDIFITTEAPLGNVAKVPKYKFAIGQRLLALSPTPNIVSTDFLLQVLQGEKFSEQLDLQSTGSTVAGIKQSTFRKIPLQIPPLPEQQKIAAILSSVDDVIEKTQAQLDKLKDLKTGMMQELLTQGIGHTEFKMLPKWTTGRISEIEEIPASWELVDILSVAKLESGHTPSRDNPDYWGGEFQWVSLHDTKNLEKPLVHQTKLTITQEGLDNSSARLLPKGTVAFSRTASVGHCVIFGKEMATSQDFANYVCGDQLNNRYLLHLFRWMQHVWSNLAEGSTHKTIYMPIFKKLQILLPPLDEQEKIADMADKIDDSITAKDNKLVAVKNIKKALMQDLLTGKVRVNVG